MTTLFISDLHLSDSDPKTLAEFEHFISNQASQAEALYILGDLFEVWVGDDDPSQAAQRVANALHALSQKGIRIFYVHGNRDFLLGHHYATRCGMQVLADPTVIECEGKKILLTHGDLLCTDDESYQKMRKIVHTPWVQKLFLVLPRFIRQAIASMMRKQSGKAHLYKTESSMDVNSEAVVSWLDKNGVTFMVHGHTHKPAHHQIKDKHRYVLGAWDIKPAILVFAGGQMILKDLG